MNELITNIVKAIYNIPEDKASEILKIGKFKEIKKHGNFIREGEIPNKFALVLNGLFRYYYVGANGSEYTKGFFPEGTIISSYSAMIQNRGSYFTIEALEDCHVFEILYQSWLNDLEKYDCWKMFLIKILEKGYCTKESRERELLLLDAETRYRNFLKAFPNLEKRVKQHYIASYLGIVKK